MGQCVSGISHCSRSATRAVLRFQRRVRGRRARSHRRDGRHVRDAAIRHLRARIVDARRRRADPPLDLLRRQVRPQREHARGDTRDDRRGERRAAAKIRTASAVMIRAGDRRAEDPLRRREHFHTTAAGAAPRMIVRSHAAYGDHALELRAQRCGETVDRAGRAATAVSVVRCHDEEESLAVRVRTAVGVVPSRIAQLTVNPL